MCVWCFLLFGVLDLFVCLFYLVFGVFFYCYLFLFLFFGYFLLFFVPVCVRYSILYYFHHYYHPCFAPIQTLDKNNTYLFLFLSERVISFCHIPVSYLFLPSLGERQDPVILKRCLREGKNTLLILLRVLLVLFPCHSITYIRYLRKKLLASALVFHNVLQEGNWRNIQVDNFTCLDTCMDFSPVQMVYETLLTSFNRAT